MAEDGSDRFPDGGAPDGGSPEEVTAFLRRWSQRKQAQARGPQPAVEPVPAPATVHPEPSAPLPDLNTLSESSDYSAFLGAKVGEELRRLALRRLFHMPKFNIRDGLDDYDDDYYRLFNAAAAAVGDALRGHMARSTRDAVQAPGDKPAADARKDPPGADTRPGAGEDPAGEGPAGNVLHGVPSTVDGFLGCFRVTVVQAGGQEASLVRPGEPSADHFDLVLDLSCPPLVHREIPPPGYFAPQTDPRALERCLTDLPELVGEFQKPKFFNYNPDICAHGRSGISGCTRCIQACPTGAITSLAERIEVNPYLCQGAGSCTTVCPSGAITYGYPTAAGLLGALRQSLKAYRDAGGEHAPVVVLHDGEAGAAMLQGALSTLPEWTLPVELEGVASAGMDLWLAALAYGAGRVLVLAPPAMPDSEKRALQTQIAYTGAVLNGMGYDGGAIRLVYDTPSMAAAVGHGQDVACPAAGFAGFDEKRTTLRLAIGHLHAHAPRQVPVAELPAGAPFGEIRVNPERCTLCMSCVSVCPVSALADGDDLPQLRFVEINCVQCGLCSATCPEGAIDLHARINYDQHAAGVARLLHEEQPFNCVVCGKPFATRKMIERMNEKLSGHWMFRAPEALRRLQMCEDCRVQDIFAAGGGLDVYDRPRDS